MAALGLVNTQAFRETATYFDKHKQYEAGIPGTLENKEFWNREIDRCLNGYTTGGIYISGYYYFYLNFCRIQIVEETYKEVHKTKVKHARKAGERKESFPDFWDVDYVYFTALDIAQNGIDKGDLLKLPVSININEDSLGGGHHMAWLKPRGVGASWKGGSLAARNFSLIRQSKSYMMANEKEFLTKDGIFSKFLEFKDWLIVHAEGIGKVSEFKEDRNNMHIRASIDIEGIERGYMSEVFGVSLQNNWQKARGKRGQLILWEELGKFPNADKAWEIARPSVEEGDVNFGTMIGFGTGGTEGANFESLERMFYDPLSYNLIAFDNIWDEGMSGTKCGLFTPAYYNIKFKDAQGNSNKELAKDYFDGERELAQKAKDPSLLPRKKAEAPYTPKEAVLKGSGNIFMSDELINQRQKVFVSRSYETLGTKGYFKREGFDLKFKPDPLLNPIHLFPHKDRYQDYSGAVVVYEAPYKKDSKIPNNLYKLCLDTYRHDSTTGDSVGAAYVIKQANNFTADKGDRIVASYVGRPNSQETFNKVVFELAEYYNAEIAFENDEPGDVVGYAKRHKKIHMLAEEFELAYDVTLQSAKTKRGFGMHMGSGKENKRKKQGDVYIKEWLYTIRYTAEDGTEILNLHTIFDLGLLDELMAYGEGNFDRISALRIGIYHMQELLYTETVPSLPIRSSIDDFFSRDFFPDN